MIPSLQAEYRRYKALHRSPVHIWYYVGQVVHGAHAFKGAGRTCRSIPPGGSAGGRA